MKKVKITAIRKACFPDLMEKYEKPIQHACDIQEGQVWIANKERLAPMASRWGWIVLFLLPFPVIDYRYVGKATLVFSAPSQVVVSAVDGTSTALALHKIVAVFGFDFLTADIAADCILDNHCIPSFVDNSCIKTTPSRSPSRKASRSCSTQRSLTVVKIGSNSCMERCEYCFRKAAKLSRIF